MAWALFYNFVWLYIGLALFLFFGSEYWISYFVSQTVKHCLDFISIKHLIFSILSSSIVPNKKGPHQYSLLIFYFWQLGENLECKFGFTDMHYILKSQMQNPHLSLFGMHTQLSNVHLFCSYFYTTGIFMTFWQLLCPSTLLICFNDSF